MFDHLGCILGVLGSILGAFGCILGAFFGYFVAYAAFQKTLKKTLGFHWFFDVLGGSEGVLEACWKVFWAMLVRI